MAISCYIITKYNLKSKKPDTINDDALQSMNHGADTLHNIPS